MGEVTISVAGRAYQVVCEDGEENRLAAIAARVDREAQTFGGATPSLSEPRLLLMCALLLADKLDEVETAPQAAPALPEASAVSEVDASTIDEATARIDAMAQSDSLEAEPSDMPASPSGETELAPEASPEPAEQTERPSKSSAAVAAEKDLLSWADRSDAREDTDVPEEEVEPEAEVAETVAPDPTPSSESMAEDDGPAEVAVEDEAELAARERSDRRKRRRERLARLANETSDDP